MNWDKDILGATKEELIGYIKEINFLVGAIDGDAKKYIRNLIQAYNLACWRERQYKILLEMILDRLKWGEEIKLQSFEKMKNEIEKKGAEKCVMCMGKN